MATRKSSDALKSVFLWAVKSTYFKKWIGIFGGICFGYLVGMDYHKEVNATLEIWHIDKEEFRRMLIWGAGLLGTGGSLVLSMLKTHLGKRQP